MINHHLVERVRKILLTPKLEWQFIDTEQTTVSGLYTSYVMPLAAIGPVASLLGLVIFGAGMGAFHFRPRIGDILVYAILQYVSTLVGTYIVALVIDALAPTFGGKKDLVQALKVTAYSSTAAWVAGIFGIVPVLSVLGVLGLYSLYLLWLGLPLLMKSPPDKAIGYNVVAIAVAIVVFFVFGSMVSRMVLGGAA